MITKKIIGLVGETGSGKDTFCHYIEKSFEPVFCFRFSDCLSKILKIFFNEIKKEDQQWLGENLRKRFGNNILGEAVAKKIKNIKKGIIILNGIRAFEEFEMIKKIGGRIVYITADSKIRWQRLQKRGEKKDDSLPYGKFLELEKAKTEILISKIAQKSDFRVENNNSKEFFYREIKKITEKIC